MALLRSVRTVRRLAPRPADANKTTVGRVLVVGGSRGMTGAPALAALGALRAGAGLVRVAVPRSVQGTVAGYRPETTTLGLPEDDQGFLDGRAVDVLLQETPGWDVVVLGPGAGRTVNALEAMRVLPSRMDRPLVLDADGLFAWNGRLEELSDRPGATVLTPHAGEAGRLLGVESREIEHDREAAIERLATAASAVVVLKGRATLVSDGRRLYRNHSGSAALASGGTGDLLSGMIAALWASADASGWDAFDAACAAVHVHGLAAERAAHGLDRGILASDMAAEVPAALGTLVAGTRAGKGRSDARTRSRR